MRPYENSSIEMSPSRRPLRVLLVLALLACVVVAVVSVATGSSHTAPSRDSTGTTNQHLESSSRQSIEGRRQTSASSAAAAATRTGATRTTPSAGQSGDAQSGTLTMAQMLGQMIVARFPGPSPSTSFLARVRAGQVGGVILFGDNLTGGEAATRELIGQLQQVAREGGNPPLLIMTDQEGGTVRRLSWAPPTISASAMGSAALARSEGEAAGRALRAVGVNMDLAPVADVERITDSFLGTRSFGSSPGPVAAHACAFAEGLAAAGVGFTLKHFPGLGRASADTDLQPVTIDASAAALREDYRAYRKCGAQPYAAVMISSASYPALTGTPQPAVLSPEIYRTELPYATDGGVPLTVSDDLQTPAIIDQANAAERAIDAGLDLLMYAQTEAGSADAYDRLLAVARAGGISHARLAAADRAVLAFKRLVAPSAGYPPAVSPSASSPASPASGGGVKVAPGAPSDAEIRKEQYESEHIP